VGERGRERGRDGETEIDPLVRTCGIQIKYRYIYRTGIYIGTCKFVCYSNMYYTYLKDLRVWVACLYPTSV